MMHGISYFLSITEMEVIMRQNDRFGVRKMALLAVFTAMAYAVTLIFRINVSFLTFDAKDAIVCITAMIFGPLSGVVVSLLVATIEQITVGDTAFGDG